MGFINRFTNEYYYGDRQCRLFNGEWVWDDEFEKNQEDINDLLLRVRSERNRRLQDTDWTQLKDTSLFLEKTELFVQYREALRNITESIKDGLVTSYDKVVFPDCPMV